MDDVTVSEAFVHSSWYKFFYYCPNGYYCYSSGHNGHSSKGNLWPLAMYPDPRVAKKNPTETDLKFLTIGMAKQDFRSFQETSTYLYRTFGKNREGM